MAYIKVDCSKFESAALEIDAYVALMKRSMDSARNEVTALSANWQGLDFTAFQAQWDRVADRDSTYTQMVKSLESYAQYLRYAAGRYKAAQANAVNRANSLPMY